MTYIGNLIDDLHKASQEDNTWECSSFHHDATGSVMYKLDDTENGENFVQLFAFETKAQADAEQLEMYSITTATDGEWVHDAWTSNDGNEVISKAIELSHVLGLAWISNMDGAN